MLNQTMLSEQLHPYADRLEHAFSLYVREKTQVWTAEKRSTSALPQGLRQIGDQTQFTLNDFLVRIGYVIAHGDSRERAVIVREMMLTHDRLEVLRAQGKPKQGKKQKKKGA